MFPTEKDYDKESEMIQILSQQILLMRMDQQSSIVNEETRPSIFSKFVRNASQGIQGRSMKIECDYTTINCSCLCTRHKDWKS